MTLQSVSFQRARQGMILAASGTGIRVTASSGMTVSIAAGTYFLGGKTITYAGANVTAETADATNNRYDVVVLDINGTASIVKGTAAASPTVPLFKDDVMPVAILVITANDATIASADIIDMRDFAGLTADGTTISVSADGVLSVVQSGLSRFPSVVAAGSGSTAITGNGTAQNVFTDTFTALATGEAVQIHLRYIVSITAGADTPDIVVKLGSPNIFTQSNAATGDARYLRVFYVKGASGTQGYGTVESIANAATGTDAWAVAKNDVGGYTTAIDGLTLTADPAAATNCTVTYEYHVLKYGTGV